MKVSIIVPVYNMETKLKRCLDSIIKQTYKNIEIIVVNDGSTDGSLNIINSYSKHDKRIIVVDQKNKGISVARNNAIKKSTGEYLCFVDSDDYIELNMIDDLVKAMRGSKADIIVCNYYVFSDENNKVEVNIGADELFGGTLYDNPQLIRKIDYAPWNKIYRKELFNNISFPPKTKYEDFDAILKVFSKANKIEKLNKPLYNYYVNPNGETRTNNSKNRDMLKIANNLNDYFDFDGKDQILKESFFETISEKLLNSAASILKTCDTKTSIKYIKDIYAFLDINCSNWKKLYMNNDFDSKYIKTIRGHKLYFITYTILRNILKRD